MATQAPEGWRCSRNIQISQILGFSGRLSARFCTVKPAASHGTERLTTHAVTAIMAIAYRTSLERSDVISHSTCALVASTMLLMLSSNFAYAEKNPDLMMMEIKFMIAGQEVQK